MNNKLLVASPVRQKPNILMEFLFGLEQLEKKQFTLNFLFIDDNTQQECSELLANFAKKNKNVVIWKSNTAGFYECDENFHKWQEEIIWKVAEFKDKFIHYAVANNYDYLFLVDSDIVLQPETLFHLAALEKDIVAEVFWTRWSPGVEECPQVWVKDHYTLYEANRHELLEPEVVYQRTQKFFNKLRKPGIYKVGGLGACTLISRKALIGGVSFKEISNLSIWGEDRHFCIRAVALGFELWSDTHYPPFHIYRESELAELVEFKERIFRNRYRGSDSQQRQGLNKTATKLTLGMVVKDEGDRYLKRVLAHAVQYIDEAVIIDDASTDNTREICREALKGVSFKLHTNEKSLFGVEYKLRKQLWELVLATNPDWILVLDADEVFEDRAVVELRKLIKDREKYYYAFRLYDFWDEHQYREDRYWCAHYIYRPFMVRYAQGFQYLWQETPQHCGRLPLNITNLQGCNSSLRIKHLGWMRPIDRITKYERYQLLDPDAEYGIKEQYESILDPNPRRVRWEEDDI